MVAERQFRQDLYFRLNVFPVVMPPLRDRAADIPDLARHFVDEHSRRMNKRIDLDSGADDGDALPVFMAGKHTGIAELHRALGDPVQRPAAARAAGGAGAEFRKRPRRARSMKRSAGIS